MTAAPTCCATGGAGAGLVRPHLRPAPRRHGSARSGRTARSPVEQRGDALVGRRARRRPLDVTDLEVSAGDRLLLCSDGLPTSSTDARISEVLRPADPHSAAAVLTQSALAAGGRDNITALVLDVVEGPLVVGDGRVLGGARRRQQRGGPRLGPRRRTPDAVAPWETSSGPLPAAVSGRAGRTTWSSSPDTDTVRHSLNTGVLPPHGPQWLHNLHTCHSPHSHLRRDRWGRRISRRR